VVAGQAEAVQRIWLTGMMGSGKSTVGSELADRLGWRLVDTDAEVEHRAGRAIAELWAEQGEPAFRSLEARVIEEVAGMPGAAVISVGGGAVVDPGNRSRMSASGLVVWLRAEVGTLVDRVGAGETRPLLGGDPKGALARVAEARRAYYSEADLVVDVDEVDPDEAASTIVALAAGMLARA
jgi:shikimate kinase